MRIVFPQCSPLSQIPFAPPSEEAGRFTRFCWRVLTLDKELLLFPVMLGLALALTNTGMLAILRIGPGSLTEIFGGRVEVSAQPRAGFGLTHYLTLILFHFINYIVIIYFCAALIGRGPHPFPRWLPHHLRRLPGRQLQPHRHHRLGLHIRHRMPLSTTSSKRSRGLG